MSAQLAHPATAVTPNLAAAASQTAGLASLHNTPLQGVMQHSLHENGQNDGSLFGPGAANDHFAEIHAVQNPGMNPAVFETPVLEAPHNFITYGTEGNDTRSGGSGNDIIYGLAGDDVIHGGGGNDLMHGGAGSDTLYGGDGNDALYGDDSGGGSFDVDSLYGGAGNDFLQAGTNFSSIIDGGDGNDTLVGNGHSLDLMTGGAGADVFVVSGYNNIVSDFSAADGDRIQGHGGFAEFAGSMTGTGDAESYVQNLHDQGQLAGHIGNVFIYNEQTNTGYIVQDKDGDGFFETSATITGCGHADDMTAASILYV